MTLRKGLKFAVAAAFALAAWPAIAASPPSDAAPPVPAKPAMSAAEMAAQQAAAQRQQLVEAAQSDRAGTIRSIMNRWQSSLGNDANVERVQRVLEAAAAGTLADILGASSYDEVRTILSGGTADALDAGILNLGDLQRDLTYTPINPPCRAVDTRNIGGPIPAASIRSWIVWGGNLAFQGGNAAGCPNPGPGAPLAGSLNIAALPQGIAGHLRVYPFLNALPTVSFVNYPGTVNNNIANAGIISLCPGGCANDISIYNASAVHYLVDVMGWFFRATDVPLGLSRTAATTAVAGGCTNYAGGQVTITVPGPGYITVTAQAWMIRSANNQTGILYIGSSNVDCPFGNAAEGYQSQPYGFGVDAGEGSTSVSLSRSIFFGSAGTRTYYLNATGAGTFWYAAMQARYSPRP